MCGVGDLAPGPRSKTKNASNKLQRSDEKKINNPLSSSLFSLYIYNRTAIIRSFFSAQGSTEVGATQSYITRGLTQFPGLTIHASHRLLIFY